MRTDLTNKALEFVLFMIIMFSFGIMVDTPKLSRCILLAYLNVFLDLAVLFECVHNILDAAFQQYD
jgi:hypothetical protein